jgi:hypothetical protein
MPTATQTHRHAHQLGCEVHRRRRRESRLDPRPSYGYEATNWMRCQQKPQTWSLYAKRFARICYHVET